MCLVSTRSFILFWFVFSNNITVIFRLKTVTTLQFLLHIVQYRYFKLLLLLPRCRCLFFPSSIAFYSNATPKNDSYMCRIHTLHLIIPMKWSENMFSFLRFVPACSSLSVFVYFTLYSWYKFLATILKIASSKLLVSDVFQCADDEYSMVDIDTCRFGQHAVLFDW